MTDTIGTSDKGRGEDVLQVCGPRDTLEFIRKHPDLYVPFGQLRGSNFAVQLADEVINVSKQPVCILQWQEWWVIACEEDWISGLLGGVSIEEYFMNTIAFPEYGANRVHFEVVIRAFSESLTTATSDGALGALVGSPPPEGLLAIVSRSLPYWRRIVAFRLSA